MSQPVRTGVTLVILMALFFIVGLIASQNELLNPLFKDAFSLRHAEAALIQFVYFGVYVLLAIPLGKLAERYGYHSVLRIALFTVGLGALLFWLAASMGGFGWFLAGVMILALGNSAIIILGNPYVTLLGASEKSPQRLNLVNGFYMVGTTTGPVLGSLVYVDQVQQAGVVALGMPYMALGMALVVLAVLFRKSLLPEVVPRHHHHDHSHGTFSLLKDSRLMLGILAMFLYVGAEIGAASKLVDWLTQPDIMNMEKAKASRFLALYWGLTMALRFVSVGLMRWVRPVSLLVFTATLGVVLVGLVVSLSGSISGIALVLLGAANSVMFPTIFALSTQHLGPHTQRGGSYVMMAVVGGAIVPVVIGAISDWQGLRLGLGFLMTCYFAILVFGLKVYRTKMHV